jgi:hypothetical protein
MDTTQAEKMKASLDSIDLDISIPIKTLFDECLCFISVNDFVV